MASYAVTIERTVSQRRTVVIEADTRDAIINNAGAIAKHFDGAGWETIERAAPRPAVTVKPTDKSPDASIAGILDGAN